MTSLTRVAWEGRDSVIRLQETVPLAASKRAGGAPEHRPRNVVTINNDTGRSMSQISRYCPATFGDAELVPVAQKSASAGGKRGTVANDDEVEADSSRSLASEMMDPEEPTDAEVREYRRLCKNVGVVPAKFYERYFEEHTFAMNHHGLGSQGAKALSEALHDNDHITTLELADNGIACNGMRQVIKMLLHNHNISKLDLSSNMLKSGGLALAAQHFGCGQSRVEEINLSSNGFLDMDAQAACGALQGNLVLRVLDLSKNQFGDIAAKHFGALLAENATLEELNLSGNCIRQRGAKMIASGIAANVALVRLNLNDNGLGTAGMTAIAEALSSNSTLTQLDVAGNNISNAAAIALGAALRSHKALVKVDVSSNPITGSGMRALFEALGARGTPVEITFNGITLDNESIAAMEQASKLNPDTRFYGDFPTFEGFDSVREQAMQASDRMSKHGPDWKPRVSIPINTQDVGSDPREVTAVVEDGADEGPSGLPKHLSRSTKGNMWDGVDGKDLKRRGVSRSSLMIDPKELAAFDDNDPQADRMRMWAIAHPDLPDPMLALEKYVYSTRLRLVDFFFSIDKNRSGGVTKDELTQAVDVLDGLDMTRLQMEELIERLDVNNDGEINYEEMCEGRKEITEKLRARDPRWTTRQSHDSGSESSDDSDG
eukprot:m.24154 g.24154  ORF g.24154 m.24154 type:complete len:660 (-) comp11158_c0_seq1:144-2123(-)